MDRRQLTIMANKFQSVFDPSTLNDQGDQLEFCQRQRLITPFRFGLSVVASMASQQVQSIADLQRDFNALWDLEVSDKAFSNQLAKPSCSEFLRTSLCDIMGKLTMKVLGFQEAAALSNLPQFSIQAAIPFPTPDPRPRVFPVASVL